MGSGHIINFAYIPVENVKKYHTKSLISPCESQKESLCGILTIRYFCEGSVNLQRQVDFFLLPTTDIRQAKSSYYHQLTSGGWVRLHHKAKIQVWFWWWSIRAWFKMWSTRFLFQSFFCYKFSKILISHCWFGTLVIFHNKYICIVPRYVSK